MSSASQMLFGSIQGKDADVTNITAPELSTLIIEDSPLVYWKVEGNGSTEEETDYSGNGYTTSGAQFTPTAPIRGGESTQAGFFAYDSGDNLQDSTAPAPTLADQTSWTMECVVQIADLPNVGTFYGIIMGEMQDYLNGEHANTIIFENIETGAPNKQLRIRTDLGGSSYQIGYNWLVDTTAPVHVVGVRDDTDLSIYINGSLVSQRTDLPTGVVPGTVDRRYAVSALAFPTSFQLDFTICDVASYTYALSADRIARHAAAARI